MEKKINIAELLKDCPKGMELNCTIYENVELDYIAQDPESKYPIHCLIKLNGGCNPLVLTHNGCYDRHPNAKCVIFPKGKTTWEGFVPPCQFKDGDILATDLGSVFILNTHLNTDECYGCYTGVCCDGVFYINESFAYKECCNFATEEEKEELFQTIKDNGYEWNAETKTLKKLIVEPKFKVGDVVRSKNCPTAGNFVIIGVEEDNYSINLENYCIKFKDQDNYEVINKPKFKVGDRVKPTYNTNQYIIKEITTTHYTLEEVKHKFKYTEPIINDKDWELVSDKFDINTFKPFDQILVRLTNNCVWIPKFFSHLDNKNVKYYPFVTTDNVGYPQCVPYNGNEHLCRTTDDCDEFYRVWGK